MILGLDILNLKCPWHLQLKMPSSQFCMSIWSVGFPRWFSSKSSCQCGRPRSYPWVRKIPQRREWQPTSLFLPRKFHGQRNLMGCSPWGHKESDMTKQLTQTHTVSVVAETMCVRYVKQGRRVRGKESSELKTEWEKAMAPHSSTLAWKIPWMEEPGRLQSVGSLRVRHDQRLHFHFSLSCIEGNGNPFQCSCLENPRDRGAWWAAIYGVTQSRTRLKRLSSSSSKGRMGGKFSLQRKLYCTLSSPFTTKALTSPASRNTDCGLLPALSEGSEKTMATHSSVLAWRIPGTGEPGGLPSMGSCRVRHD